MIARALFVLVWALWTNLAFRSAGAGADLPPAQVNEARATGPVEVNLVRPSIQAVRVEHGPVIDGRLDDAVWALAPTGGPLYEAYQHPGRRMTERTEFRVLYDDKNLYIGVWCFDSEPSGIIAREMEHDGRIADDYCYVLLDTFHDRRNGYLFTIEPLGARSESLVTENTVVNRNWDGLWWARTSRDAEGWKVEMAIPFKTLSFNPAHSTWGFNVERQIRRKFEIGRWASPRRDAGGYMPSAAGELTGLYGLKQGLGLEFSPYLKGRYSQQQGQEDWTGDFGGDARYRLTPYLSATLSYNTDFAETEADVRQINFTRFPLFFPEKRAFFLEDSGIFEYGGLSSSSLGTALVPYFSRRIGLSATGERVPILLAGKVAGRVGQYNLGVLDAVLDDQPGLGQQNTFVGRLSRNVLEQSTVGALATVGNPNSTANNALFGPDYNFRTSDFLGRRVLEAHTFALGTWSEDQGGPFGYAYGVNVRYPNDPWTAHLDYLEIDDAFQPALGFVKQTGVRGYSAGVQYQPRPANSKLIRNYVFETQTACYTDLANALDNGAFLLRPFGLHFHSDDQFSVYAIRNFDRLQSDFEIAQGVTIPAGEYWWNQALAQVAFAAKRPVSGDVSTSIGEFYDGHRQTYSGRLVITPWKHLGFDANYSFNQVQLPGGSFDTHLLAGRMIWNFTPDLVWSHLVQYDSVSHSIGFNSRLQWEYRPGCKLYLVLNQNYARETGGFGLDGNEVILKIMAVFRL